MQRSMYSHMSGEVMLAVYVDNIIIISATDCRMVETKGMLNQHFAMTDGGEINYCLGLAIRYSRSRHELSINQGQYVESMLKKFRMKEAAEVPWS